jgi:hypothetical protein
VLAGFERLHSRKMVSDFHTTLSKLNWDTYLVLTVSRGWVT